MNDWGWIGRKVTTKTLILRFAEILLTDFFLGLGFTFRLMSGKIFLFVFVYCFGMGRRLNLFIKDQWKSFTSMLK